MHVTEVTVNFGLFKIKISIRGKDIPPPIDPLVPTPLKHVVQSVLEVLLPSFTLERANTGYKLYVGFNSNTLAIWNKEARKRLLRDTDEAVITRFEQDFRKFMVGKGGQIFTFDQIKYPDLKFRFASGGTLPIVKLDGKEYYALFYRDIHPIGWNIANGACDTERELHYPIDTIERELREETIIINPERIDNAKGTRGIRYVFPIDAEKPQDHPDFAVARKLWENHIPGIIGFPKDRVVVEWEKGPDEVIINTVPEAFNSRPKDCFININSEDLGIELDQVALIALNKGDRILDGETSRDRLLNRVIGLFDMDEVNRNLDHPYAFIPNLFFHGGKLYEEGKRVRKAISNFLDGVADIRFKEDKDLYSKKQQEKKELDLCPVTRTIIRRYIDAREKQLDSK